MNGRTQHTRAKHTSDELLEQDDFPVVSRSWPSSSSPQPEPMDEDNLLQAPTDFELSTSSDASESNTVNMLSNNSNFQQLDAEPPKYFSPSPSESPSFHPTSRSSPLQYKESTHAKYHPSINGKHIIFFSSVPSNKIPQANDVTKMENR